MLFGRPSKYWENPGSGQLLFSLVMCKFTEGWKGAREEKEGRGRRERENWIREMSVYCFDNHKVTSWKWFILWQASRHRLRRGEGSSSLLPASFSTHVLPSQLVFNQPAPSGVVPVLLPHLSSSLWYHISHPLGWVSVPLLSKTTSWQTCCSSWDS